MRYSSGSVVTQQLRLKYSIGSFEHSGASSQVLLSAPVVPAASTPGFAADGDIVYNYLVDCEEDWDYLRFYIDDVEVDAFTGLNVTGTSPLHVVLAGTHTFSWRYEKDVSLSEGADTAWIDNIITTGGALP